MVFNIPKQHDEWLTLQLLIIFVLAILINLNANGRATLFYLESEYHVSPDSPNFAYTKDYEMMQKYSQDIELRSKSVLYICLFLYFILSPAINFYYGFKIFKKGQWKKESEDLKTINALKNKGNY